MAKWRGGQSFTSGGKESAPHRAGKLRACAGKGAFKETIRQVGMNDTRTRARERRTHVCDRRREASRTKGL